MRAITGDSGKVLGFYHAETSCNYNNNGMTRKSAGYSTSTDGGKSFTKPGYPNNRVVDTDTPILLGLPSGEGDISVLVKGDYYYCFFQNVEDYHMGVARSPKSAEGYPGSFMKYNKGQWNSPGVGGNSSRLNNMAGSSVYLHTPSQSLVSVGNANPYWDQGFMMSVSDDAINWQYFGDPIFTPDPITNMDTILYPSFLGPSGGYDIGSQFQFFYMWVPPGNDWNHRYQVAKDITLTYVGQNNKDPLTKLALTTYKSDSPAEIWQTTELALPPYKPTAILGYIMSRPYPNTFAIYDCFNYTTNDHFIGNADECFLSGSGVVVTRTLGYVWAVRCAPSIAVYRCYAGVDIFLSSDPNCEGLAPAQATPWAYVMSGPALVVSQEILVPQGAAWLFYNQSSAPASAWSQKTFDDSRWATGVAPFSGSYAVSATTFGAVSYYFRYYFTVPANKVLKKLLINIASDDYSIVYINGVLVDTDPDQHHEAAYWNRRVYLNPSVVASGANTIAVLTRNYDSWAFFDCQLVAIYDTSTSTTQKSSRNVVEEEILPVQDSEIVEGEILTVQDSEVVEEEILPVQDSEIVEGETLTVQDSEPEMQREVREAPVYQAPKESRAAPITLIAAGSNWKYTKTAPASTWIQPGFDDASWTTSAAPFVTGYSAYAGKGTPFGAQDYYFRSKFTIPAGMTVQTMQVSVASDNYAIVYINGVLVDSDPATWHEAKYWNRQVNVPTSVIANGDNVIAVVTKNMDAWAFFDLQLTVEYGTATVPNGMLIAPGSNWRYSKLLPIVTWTLQAFDDALWPLAPAPFVTGYGAYVGKGTPFGNTDYYFRSKFTIPAGQSVKAMSLYVASDNYAIVYINGILVDSDPATWHEAKYWNRAVNVDPSIIISGVNQISVVTKNMDAWAFFDLQLNATYTSGGGSTTGSATTPAPTPAPTLKPTPAPTSAPTPAPTPAPNNGGVGTSVIFIAQGSNWLYYNKGALANAWTSLGFSDSSWTSAPAPFVTGYTAFAGKGTPFGPMDHYFRSKFTIPAGKTVSSLQINVASDNYGLVYVNGILVDSDPASWHQATYWNRQITVDTSILQVGSNQVAVVVRNQDAWAFFDCQVVGSYGSSSVVPSSGTVIPRGSTWAYTKAAPASTWIQQSFDDSAWTRDVAPFATGYSAYSGATPFGPQNHYFRSKFTIPAGYTPSKMQLSVASDNYAIVYINGKVVDSDPATWHEAKYWNRQLYIDTSMVISGTNTIAVVTYNQDAWAFFDLQLTAEYTIVAAETPCTPTCGIRGQCSSGKCVCDPGWGGIDCNTNLCTYTGATNNKVISSGTSFRHTQWATVASTPVGWYGNSFDDSWWPLASAPFATSYYSTRATTIAAQRHLYRKTFLVDIPYNQIIQNATISIASDDTHRVYLNGKFVGATIYPYKPHLANYWNDVIVVDGSLLSSVNAIAIEVPIVDGRWQTFFDMQLVVTTSTRACSPLAA
jgi:hypothetical protein